MNRLPLVAAQPGIWMAEQLSSLPNAWSVAQYRAERRYRCAIAGKSHR